MKQRYQTSFTTASEVNSIASARCIQVFGDLAVDETIQHSHVSIVKLVRIKFELHNEDVKAFHGLIQRGRAISLRDDEFIVPAAALDWLRSQNFTPTILAWLNQDDVIQTVRNSAAHPV